MFNRIDTRKTYEIPSKLKKKKKKKPKISDGRKEPNIGVVRLKTEGGVWRKRLRRETLNSGDIIGPIKEVEVKELIQCIRLKENIPL